MNLYMVHFSNALNTVGKSVRRSEYLKLIVGSS